jgi:hypothetical protein
VKHLINFIVGAVALYSLATGIDHLGQVVFQSNYFAFIGAIIFFGIIYWNGKMSDDIKAEKDDRVHKDKVKALKETHLARSQISEMQDNGEISEESAEELTNSINKIAEKILDINYTPSSWLIKK